MTSNSGACLLWSGIFVLASGLENHVLVAERPDCSAETLARRRQVSRATG